jgi:hypothetical protein
MLAGATVDPTTQSRSTHATMLSLTRNGRARLAIEIEIATCKTTTGRLHSAPERLNARMAPTAGTIEAIAHSQ